MAEVHSVLYLKLRTRISTMTAAERADGVTLDPKEFQALAQELSLPALRSIKWLGCMVRQHKFAPRQ